MIERGTVIGRYVVQERVGRGGMASVYRAVHQVLGTVYAFKVLEVMGSDQRTRAFQEGRIQAGLSHPNILPVIDAFEYESAPVLVLEYIEGPPLDAWLNDHNPDLESALRIFRGVVRGVRFAHLNGLIHRDLKPGNVLLKPSGDGHIPKVCDFGLAKLMDLAERGAPGMTITGSRMGTPEYQAPEQIRDASRVDFRADLFSLGAMLYELTCHQRPFTGSDMLEVYKAVATADYPHPRDLGADLPNEIELAIEGLLQVEPSDRLGSCQELLELIDGASPRTIPPRAPDLGPRPTPQIVVPDDPPAPPAMGSDPLARAVQGLVLLVLVVTLMGLAAATVFR